MDMPPQQSINPPPPLTAPDRRIAGVSPLLPGVISSTELARILGIRRRTLSDWARAQPELRRAMILRNRWSVRELVAAGFLVMPPSISAGGAA